MKDNKNNFNYLYEIDNSFVGYLEKLTKKERESIGAKLLWKRKKKKQTAIQWLEQIMDDYTDKSKDNFTLEWGFLNQLFEEAKSLEKKQIFKALQAGVNIEIGINEFNNDLTYEENFKKYYKKYE